jgi:hypothetical protein
MPIDRLEFCDTVLIKYQSVERGQQDHGMFSGMQ